MFYEKVSTYLKSNLAKPSLRFKWTDKDNEKIFSFIDENFPGISLLDEEIILDIEDAFYEYFADIGFLLFEMSDKKISMQIKPYIKPKESVNLDQLIDILEENEESIEYDYRGKKDLISIPKNVKTKIYDFVDNIHDEYINPKELIKFAIKEAFELKDSDIIVIKENQIFIKLFDKGKIRKVAESEKDTIANRFNGIDEDELKSFYSDVFSKDENKNFFYDVAEQFFDVFFIDKKINNLTYEKYAFSFIQAITAEHLIKLFDHNDDEFLKGFSGYVFRIHFKEVFGHIADLILGEISVSNSYMMDFLKYYSLNVVVLNGKKYKVPEIDAGNGLKWNVASMMSIVKIYVKTDISLREIKSNISKINKDILEFSIGSLSPVEYNANLNKSINKLSIDINHAMKRLNIHIDLIDSTADEASKSVLKDDVKTIKEEIQIKQNEKDQLSLKIVPRQQLTQYTELKKQLDSLKRQERREKMILSQNKESYQSIKNSLVKALTSKKVPIGQVKK